MSEPKTNAQIALECAVELRTNGLILTSEILSQAGKFLDWLEDAEKVSNFHKPRPAPSIPRG